MLISDKQKVIELLPQKPPFVMVSALISSNEKVTETSFQIEPDNVLCENENFSEAGLIENIAQSAALRMGYDCLINKTEPPKGFIGDVKSLEIISLPKAGTGINTRITIEDIVFGVTIIKGEVFQNENLIASCSMKVFTMSKENS